MASPKPRGNSAPLFDPNAYEITYLPDYDHEFVNDEDIVEFAKALAKPEDAGDEPSASSKSSLFITALNDWRPVYQKVRKTDSRKQKKHPPPRRGKDETREGFVYTLLKWPLLVIVMAWIVVLGAAYLLTRLYIFLYEHFVTMRGTRHRLRQRMRAAATYSDWVVAAKEMDEYLGSDAWKQSDEYAYYNSHTIRNVRNELRRLRTALDGAQSEAGKQSKQNAAEDLRTLLEASVKDNFVGVENARLYSETYYGTKDIVQSFVDEVDLSLEALSRTTELSDKDKLNMFHHLDHNYGRTALCLSGGATFAYYHFGVAKALLEANSMPEVITGTSGGALVAALLATRTDEELKKLLVPALAHRITACQDPITTWLPRWWRTGARFDSVDWARRCSWFCRGSLTFLEAYKRTGRILNVTCIPSDPHSPTVLANYLTAPDCVIWSAVLASAAVPGILNPVVLMKKTRRGTLAPYSFGHKWKDGSLRTDIPLKALNTHFNVTFSIVSQVNPHINLFFFSSRGAVGRPVTHRRGRGWRGGFLGSATEQYLKLDLAKWLKVLRHLELLPRYMGQDWSQLWLQRFSGTITLWPRSVPSDFVNILNDPDMERLERMLFQGQQSTFPKLKFIENRMKVERRIEQGIKESRRRAGAGTELEDRARLAASLSEEDLQDLLAGRQTTNGAVKPALNIPKAGHNTTAVDAGASGASPSAEPSSLSKRLTGWLSRSPTTAPADAKASPTSPPGLAVGGKRRTSVMSELKRQSGVFFDDEDLLHSEGEADGSAAASAEEWEPEDGQAETNASTL